MAQATMTVRTDANVKAQFTSLCEQFGMSANTAMNIFMRAVMEARCIPFSIGKKRDIETEYLMYLMEENRKANADCAELTIDEINEEIATYRAERKAKK